MIKLTLPNFEAQQVDLNTHAPCSRSEKLLQSMKQPIITAAGPRGSNKIEDYVILNGQCQFMENLSAALWDQEIELFVVDNYTRIWIETQKSQNPDLTFRELIPSLISGHHLDNKNDQPMESVKVPAAPQQQNSKRDIPMTENGQNFGDPQANDHEKNYKNMILQPEKLAQEDNRKKKWVGDTYQALTRDNLPVTPNVRRLQNKKKPLNTPQSLTQLITKPPHIKDDSNIDRLIQTIQQSRRSPSQLSTFLGVNLKLVRLIQHQASKPAGKNDMLTQPFSFIRPKFKDYTKWIKAQDELKLKNLLIEGLLKQKTLTYEERCNLIGQSGLKVNYPKLKFFYQKLGLPKDQYKEIQQQNPADYVKKEGIMKQFEQLICLEMANIKMRGQKAVYIDLVKISLTEIQLLIQPVSQTELEEQDDTYQNIYCQVAIDADVGMVGFQIYYRMPKVNEMMDFVSKVYIKFKDSPLTDDSSLAKPYSKGRWVILPNNQATYPRVLNEMLKKTGMRAIILQTEQMNQRLNCARGIWPYLASIWDAQPSDDFHHRVVDEGSNRQIIQLKDRIIACLLDMSNHNLKGISACYNNDAILKALGRRKDQIPPIVQGCHYNIAAEKW